MLVKVTVFVNRKETPANISDTAVFRMSISSSVYRKQATEQKIIRCATLAYSGEPEHNGLFFV